MNDTDLAHCRDFARTVFGAGVSQEVLDTTLGFCGSFADFRIRYVAELAPHNDSARVILERWTRAISRSHQQLDGNTLLNMLEGLSARLTTLQDKLQVAADDNVERLRVIDANATVLVSLQESSDEIRQSLAAIRARLEVLDEVSTKLEEIKNDL